MQNNAEMIQLTGSKLYIAEDNLLAYLVAEGDVFVYFVSIIEGKVGRRYLLGELKEGDLIPAIRMEYKETIWAIATVPLDSAVIKKVTEISEEKMASLGKLINVEAKSIEELGEAFLNKVLQLQEREKKAITENKYKEEEVAHQGLALIYTLFNKKNKHISQDDSSGNNLYDTVKVLCEHQHIPLCDYKDIETNCDQGIGVEDIARISHFACREVILEEGWWHQDNGPLLISTIDEEKPIACIPKSPGKYRAYDLTNQTDQPVTKELAQTFFPKGYMLYKPLPYKKLDYKDLFVFGTSGVWKRDIIYFLALTLFGTLIGLLMPYLNEQIFDQYIPMGHRSQLIQTGLIILSFSIGSLFMGMVKNLAAFRSTNMMEYSVQNAVFDRLFNMPTQFYQKYESGELAERAMGITTIFNAMTDMVVSTVFSALFSVLYLWRMFKYSKHLAGVGIIMVSISIVLTLAVGFIQIKYEKQLTIINAKLSGMMFQLLGGIAKIRIAGAENRAILRYLEDYTHARKIMLTKGKLGNIVNALSTLLSTFFSVVLYYIMITKKIEISFGAFMGFSSAFGSFSGAIMGIATTFIKVNNIIPLYQRAKPILQTLPEYEENVALPGELKGGFEVSNVSFRYEQDGPEILKDISFSVRPGEYIGIVGASGSGKSTLFKILLGFEKPEQGKIYYDDKDINGIDKRELRKRFGVVLQDGQLVSGSIFENIRITNPKLTLKRVREVVENVGLKGDVDEMPMGLHTELSEDSGTISGGQKQRILIARAIANNPKIIYFDEATSALDNITQAIVCESLEKLKTTRVVIAHRLSTIINCDRILVIDEGRLIEQGNYEELMTKQGVFHELASRQMI